MLHNYFAQTYSLVIFIYCIDLGHFIVLFPEYATTDWIFDRDIMHLSWILPFVVCRLFRPRSDEVTAEKFFDPTVGVDTFRSEAFISVFAYEDFVRHSVEQVKKLLLL